MKLQPRLAMILAAAFTAALVALGISGQWVRGQDPARTAAGDEAKAGRLDETLFDRWKREAAEYCVTLKTEPETPAALRAEPVLRWTNPVRGTYDGLVLLWLAGGRPEAVACFYRVMQEGQPIEAHEFHSLSSVPLITTLGERTVWAPRGPGVIAKPIPGAPRPAPTPAGRLRQMRALARDFKATVDLERGRFELRLLSQPAFRYESQADGALFAFVQSTDPEALLMVDDRPGDGGPAWHYAFARMSNHSLAGTYRDQVVWKMAVDNDDHDPAKPYWVHWDVGPRAPLAR